MNELRSRAARLAIAASLAFFSTTAFSQSADSERTSDVANETGRLEEIVVTAQKKAETANRVGMSITALSEDTLAKRGVVTTADLAKVVPGFSYSNALYGTPVYTLRGMGFNDTSSAAAPAVALYVDEVPLPFPILASIAPIDVERVEVLKGPQGTLFGQNSTGGAINYIAAKPTDMFQAGGTFTYGRFNDALTEAFVSGPISSTLKGRLAVSGETGGDWQRSYTRSDGLGEKRRLSVRPLLNWNPTEKLALMFSLSGWRDTSDQPAPQFVGRRPNDPRNALVPLANQPLAPDNARAADWSPERTPSKDQKFAQASLRADYELSDAVALTSISSFQYFKRNDFVDADGTQYEVLDFNQYGKFRDAYQEVRLIGNTPGLKWIAGANVSRDHVDEALDYRFRDSTTSLAFGALPFNHLVAPEHHLIKTVAAFAHGEFELTDSLSVQGAVRYTELNRDLATCTQDAGDGVSAAAFEFLQGLRKGPANVIPIPPGGCITLDRQNNPTFTELTLKENNVSWRGAVNWTVRPGTLLYANISKGYKAGGFPLFVASNTGGFVPLRQEAVLAYETGVKASLFDRTMQINGAVFYYDYTDKQLLGKRLDPFFGAVNAYVNIPKSEVYGSEIQIDWVPLHGLTLSGAATYLHAAVTSTFPNFNTLSQPIDFKGERFPFTPKWSWDLDGEYEGNASDSLIAFAGFHVNSRTRTTSSLGATSFFYVPARTLLDLRAGIGAGDGSWRLQLWAKNVTNKYYWTDRQISQDPIFQNAGAPRTYGLTLGYKFR